MHAYVDTNTVGGYAFLKDLKKKRGSVMLWEEEEV